VSSANTTITRLPPGDSLSEPTPDPSVWSCTVSSLGRGPVTWTFRPGDYLGGMISRTIWFTTPASYRPASMMTNLFFNLENSVFRGRPFRQTPTDDRDRDSLIHNIGANAHSLTPWVDAFDSARWYTDRIDYPDGSNPGWRFYQGLGWKIRADLATGWMEVGMDWYCDDKERGRP